MADGAILVSAEPVSERKSKDDESDPVVASFLQFMEKQMTEHPEDIVAADTGQLRHIGRLVKGIETT
ncbi:MAG: type II toxin-antitoxin system PrlF family antitoxin [Pseudomonadota bacterium]